MSESKWNNKKVGALWEKTSSKGTKYWTGTVEGKKVLIFRNKKNEGDEGNSPDLTVYESNPQGSAPQAANSKPAAPAVKSKPVAAAVKPTPKKVEQVTEQSEETGTDGEVSW